MAINSLPNSKADYLKNIKNIAIYVRKSRVSQDQSEEQTLEKHRTQLLNFARENDLKYYLFEEVISGTSTERVEFNKMVYLISQGTFDAVLVIHIDRLGRNEIDTAKLRKELKESETLILQLEPFDVIDLNNDMDLTKVQLQAVFAEYEGREIKRRLKGGKNRRALEGEWVNPTIPFGYVRNKTTKRLEINAEQAKVIHQIIEMFFEGQTPRQIAYILNAEKVPSPKDTVWRDKGIRLMITDEVYIGTAIYGKSKYISRSKKVDKPREEWIIAPNAHPPIIDEATHNKILAIFEDRKRIHGKAQHSNHLLSGLLKCEICGSTFHFSKTVRGVHLRKCCNRDAIGNKCINNNKGVAVPVLIEALKIELENKRAELFKPLEKEKINQDENRLKIKKLEAEIAKINLGLERVLELYEYGNLDRIAYNKKVAERNAQKEVLQKRLNSYQVKGGLPGNTLEDKVKILDEILQAIGENIQIEDTINRTNKNLRKIIDQIIYRNPNGDKIQLEITYK